MKKQNKFLCLILLLNVLIFGISRAWADISLSAFPDSEFRNYVRVNYDIGWETGKFESGKPIKEGFNDGILSGPELETVRQTTEISVANYYTIKSLEGIENFTALQELYCGHNQITRLEIHSSNLRFLSCHTNLEMTELNVSGCIALEELECPYTGLTELNVSGCSALTKLNCDCSLLKKLKLSGLPSLKYLSCGGDYGENEAHLPEPRQLVELDVSGLKTLESLECSGNELTKINVSGCSALTSLSCSDMPLTELNVSGCSALTSLYCPRAKLTELNVSGLSALKSLICYENRLKSLDTEDCSSLTELDCWSNDLTELNLRGCTALTDLDCHSNHLTELNLSTCPKLLEVDEYKHDEYKHGVYTYDQKINGLKLTKVENGYKFNFHDYLNEIKNVNFDLVEAYVYVDNEYSDRNPNLVHINVSDASEGTVIFSSYPEELHYRYQTHSPNNHLMEVIITGVTVSEEAPDSPETEVEVAVLERGTDNMIICDVTESGYLDRNGIQLTEAAIARYDYGTYGKLGFAADGNSRLILRVQTNKAGTVRFTPEEDLGLQLQRLTDGKYTNDVFTEPLDKTKYQASMVLIAPEAFPVDRKNFPSDSFKVKVSFYAFDDTSAEKEINLRIEAAPVVLIHGLGDEGSACFGVGKNSGIWHCLRESGFRDVRIWNYDGTRGPNDTLNDIGSNNGLYTALTEVFTKYDKRGIVCTRADLVCHSMGGLMARKFLDETGKDVIDGNNWSYTSYKRGMVRRVVTVATPHRGSPFAEFALEHKTLAKKFFGNRDCTSAFIDLMTTAPRSYGFPANVPMYSIYGDISDELERIAQQLGILGTGLEWFSNTAKFAPPMLLFFVNITAFGSSSVSDILTKINDDMFMGQGHDIVVGIPSATADFNGYSSGYTGWSSMHTNICHQNFTGYEVASLLKSNVNMFKIFGAKSDTAIVRNSISNIMTTANSENTEDFKFIEALNLKIEPSVFTVSDNNSQTITFTASVSNITSYDIYCAVEVGNNYRLFRMPNADSDGKTFSAKLIFTSQDTGVMSAFCFSHNPHDSEGQSIHLSNTVNILALSDISNVDVVSLDFAEGSKLYTNVGSEVPTNLYAVDSEGRYYDVSSPLLGTKWTSDEYARVNENGCVYGLKEGTTTLTANFKGLNASINVNVGATFTDDASSEEPQPTPEDSPSNNEDSANSGDNSGTAPDLNNPEINNAKPENIHEMNIIVFDNGKEIEIKAGVYTEPVKVTSLTTEEVRSILGSLWLNMPLRSVTTDMEQSDNRTDTEKSALIKEMAESQNNQVKYIYVLMPMKPTKSGIFTFALPLPSDMEVGDKLIWAFKRSLSNADEDEAVFIDTVKKEETKVVPESRAVSVSTYLEAGYTYEPVVMTVSNDDASLGSSGSGCNAAFLGMLMFPLALIFASKKS